MKGLSSCGVRSWYTTLKASSNKDSITLSSSFFCSRSRSCSCSSQVWCCLSLGILRLFFVEVRRRWNGHPSWLRLCSAHHFLRRPRFFTVRENLLCSLFCFFFLPCLPFFRFSTALSSSWLRVGISSSICLPLGSVPVGGSSVVTALMGVTVELTSCISGRLSDLTTGVSIRCPIHSFGNPLPCSQCSHSFLLTTDMIRSRSHRLARSCTIEAEWSDSISSIPMISIFALSTISFSLTMASSKSISSVLDALEPTFNLGSVTNEGTDPEDELLSSSWSNVGIEAVSAPSVCSLGLSDGSEPLSLLMLAFETFLVISGGGFESSSLLSLSLVFFRSSIGRTTGGGIVDSSSLSPSSSLLSSCIIFRWIKGGGPSELVSLSLSVSSTGTNLTWIRGGGGTELSSLSLSSSPHPWAFIASLDSFLHRSTFGPSSIAQKAISSGSDARLPWSFVRFLWSAMRFRQSFFWWPGLSQ